MARPRDASIDAAVVEACAQLLDEVGRAGLSRQLVARRAGVSLPAVTRRFLSVDDLVLAVASRPAVTRPAPSASAGLERSLVAMLHDLTGGTGPAGGRRAAAELTAAATGDPRVARALAAAEQAARAAPLAVLRAAQEHGDLPADLDPDRLLDRLVGLVRYRQLWFGEYFSEADLDHLVAEVLRAVGVPATDR